MTTTISDLSRALRAVLRAAATDDRHHLKGVYLERTPGELAGGGSVVAVATDHHRIHVAEVLGGDFLMGTSSVFLPTSFCQAVIDNARARKKIGQGKASAFIARTHEDVHLFVGEETSASAAAPMNKGNVPHTAWRNVVPKSGNQTATPSLAIDARYLSDAVTCASIYNHPSEYPRNVILDVGADERKPVVIRPSRPVGFMIAVVMPTRP